MPLPDGVTPMTVSEITAGVKAVLDEEFPNVWVTGELSNVVRAASGHFYFTLKDAGAKLECAMYRGMNLRLRFEPQNGMSVFARGGVSVYAAKGNYQLLVQELMPKGIGAAELALQQLRDKLRAKGYFDPQRKRPLHRFPKRVALIASATGAAIRDMLELLRQRWPVAQVVVRPSRVQGDGAAADVAAQLRLLSDLHRAGKLPLNAIVIGRGGGSVEDLWAFNEEIVADAIFHCAVPVVSAIGHETDVTIADLVADHRAETPSAAISMLAPDCRELTDLFGDAAERLREAMLQRIRYEKQRVAQLAQRPAFRRPLDRLRELAQRLDETRDRLDRAAKGMMSRMKDRLAIQAEQLDALSPLGVLRRGYSLTLNSDGTVLRKSSDVSVGDAIVTRLEVGTIASTVTAITEPA